MQCDVALETESDQPLDLSELKLQGATRLMRFLLQSAGLNAPILWRLRVEKKLQSNGESRPVTVVSSKPWCCFVKIMPANENSAHFCCLLMPAGFHGDKVYDALKDVEDGFDRALANG